MKPIQVQHTCEVLDSMASNVEDHADLHTSSCARYADKVSLSAAVVLDV
jgi:hypothetical protein